MTKISKFLLFIFCLICLFCYIGSVNAESYVPTYWNLYINANRNFTFNNVVSGTQQSKQFDFNLGNLDTSNYNSLKGIIYVSNLMDSKFWSSSMDIELDCTDVGSVSHSGSLYTITYADGTRASVSGTEYDNYCETYDQASTFNIINYQYNFDNRPQIQMQLVDINNNAVQCEFDNNYNYSCPGGRIYKYLIIYINKSGITSNYQILLSNTLQLIVSDTQQIINNQNQNATQQHNDSQAINNNITNTYNFISDDSIESTTNTDSISNQYDTTTNNNVLNFMLIPVNFVNSIINGFGNSCSQVCLGNCSSGGFHDNFNFTFVLPCLDIRSVIGNDIYNTIDALMCVAMIFAFIRSVVGFAKKALLLEADVSSEVRVF